MRRKKKSGLYLDGNVTLHPVLKQKEQNRDGQGSAAGITVFLAWLSITLIGAGNLLDFCRLWDMGWRSGWIILLALSAAGGVILVRISEHRPFLLPAVAGALGVLGWLLRNRMSNGFLEAANAVLTSWNDYYGMQFSKFTITDSVDTETAFLYAMLWMSLFLSYMIRKRNSRLGVVLPSLLLAGLGLLVGEMPDTQALILMMGGIVLAISGMRERNVTGNRYAMLGSAKNSLLAGVIFLIGLVVFGFSGSALQEQIQEHHDTLLVKQHDLEQRLASVNWLSFSNVEDGSVTNRRVQYTGKEIFTVTLDHAPEAKMYFRGYVGDTYEDGKWTQVDEDAFLESAKKWPSYEPDYGRAILDLSYEGEQNNLFRQKTAYSMQIIYPETAGTYAYIPYFAELTTDEAETKLEVRSDAEIFRQESCDQIQLNTFGSQSIFVLYNTEKYAQMNNNYNAYVREHYTVVSTKGIGRIARLANSWEEEGYGVTEGDTTYSVPIEKVRSELWERTDYNLNLDAVPSGEDVVENFLFDSKEGYCIHYASAAVLLLRSLGVPARYVTGYAVGRDEFQKNADGTYTAVVPDQDGHAWAEVYEYGIGWVPVEVTKGADSSPHNGTGNTGGTAEQGRNQTAGGKKKQSETAETERRNSEDTEQAQSETAVGKAGLSGESQNGTGSENSGMPGTVRGILAVSVVILTGSLVVILIIWKRDHMLRSFSNRNTRKAVLSISHALFEKVSRAGVVREKDMWDEEYVQTLEEKLTFLSEGEIRNWMECVKKTAFSPYSPTKQEVLEGRNIYVKICKAIRDKDI